MNTVELLRDGYRLRDGGASADDCCVSFVFAFCFVSGCRLLYCVILLLGVVGFSGCSGGYVIGNYTFERGVCSCFARVCWMCVEVAAHSRREGVFSGVKVRERGTEMRGGRSMRVGAGGWWYEAVGDVKRLVFGDMGVQIQINAGMIAEVPLYRAVSRSAGGYM